MPWIGTAPNQTVQRTDGTRAGTQVWQQADGAGVDILSSDHDVHDQDIVAMINATLKKDGGNTATSNIPFGGFRPTNVGDAQTLTEFLTARQKFANVGSYIGTVGGTANAITLTSGFSLTAYATGQTFSFLVASTNTGAATIALDGLAAKSLFRNGGTTAVQSGDLLAGAMVEVIYDGTRFQLNSTNQVGLSSDVLARTLPVGSILMWPHETVPAGWSWLNGAAISRTGNPECYALIGTRYGPGDGSTTFNLPDWRGYAPRNYDDLATVDVDAAARTNRGDGTGGNVVGAKQQDEIKSHDHTATVTDPGHFHTERIGSAGSGGNNAVAGTTSAVTNATTINTTSTNTTGITVDNAPFGGNETRMKTVNPKFIMLVNPAQAAAGTLGVGGLQYVFDTGTTDADPGTGKIRLNNATIASATAIYLSETDAVGSPLAAMLQSIPASSIFYVTKVGAPSTYFSFTTSAVAVDGGSYDKFNSVTHGGSNGTFANGDNLVVVIMRAGAQGATGTIGPTGPNTGLDYAFATSTSGDPGSGKIGYNNATPASVTAVNISKTGRNGEALGTLIGTWDDSTTASNKGTLRSFSLDDRTKYIELTITGSLTDNTTYWTIPVSVSASGTLSAVDDIMSVTFARSGDKGADGIGGDVIGPAASVDSEIAIYSGTTGKTIKRAATTGLLKGTSGVLSAATAGTDYLAPPSGTSVLKANSGGALANATATDLGAGRHTIWIPASAMISRTTNGASRGTVETTTNKVMLSSLDFDATTQEYAQFQVRMPKSWNVSTLLAVFTWTHNNTSTNFGVVWDIQAAGVRDNVSMDGAFGSAVTSSDTGGTTNRLYISPVTAAFTPAGALAAEDLVVFQVSRVTADAADTMAIDARLCGVTLLYTTNAITDI